MSNENTESRKVLLGLLIGGVVGAGVLYTIHARNQKTPIIKKIGKTISEVGEMLENCDLGSGADVVSHIEKKIPKGVDIVNTVADWLHNGLALWKTFKKG